jgi:hypothetical protein
MKPTIKTTWAEIKAKTNREGVEFIAVAALGKYGFTTEIVQDMHEFGILPQTFLVCGETYVLREQLFQEVVRKLLENSMFLYRSVEEGEEHKRKVAAAMEDVVLDEEAVTKLASGEWTMDYVRERSAKLIQEREAEPVIPQETA